jgi:hypothetical protein
MPNMGGGTGSGQQQPLETVRSNPNPFSYQQNLGAYGGPQVAADPNYLPEREKAMRMAAMLRQET